jgi:hypothetical protein
MNEALKTFAPARAETAEEKNYRIDVLMEEAKKRIRLAVSVGDRDSLTFYTSYCKALEEEKALMKPCSICEQNTDNLVQAGCGHLECVCKTCWNGQDKESQARIRKDDCGRCQSKSH